MGSLLQDLRFGFRSLTKSPGSALVAAVTLSLGIGLCTIAFSLVYGVFGRGLDVPEPDRLRLIYITSATRGIQQDWATQHDLYDWRERQTSFQGLAAYRTSTIHLSGTEGPERYEGVFVSANLFDILGVRPILGTTFRPGDDGAGAPLTAVIGHSLWTNRYGARPDIAGTSIKVNGEAATILGVMPRGFLFPVDDQIWVAWRDQRAAAPDRRSTSAAVVGRLKPGVTWDVAGAEMATIANQLAQEYPETNRGLTTMFRTFVEDDTGPQLRAVFGGMQVATIFVLLIACANVANLLLARATLRTKEAAVRTAIGASRLRVVLPFFAETLVLATAGALVGTGIAAAGIELFDRATADVGKPYYMIFALDLPILAFVLAITLLTTLVAGAAPAVQILRSNVNTVLKDESRGASGVLGGRLSRVLVVGEIALSCALLVGAGLMVKSIVKLRNFEFPFATTTVFTARVGLFATDYPDRDRRQAFWRDLGERLHTLPGVGSAALATELPGNASGGPRISIEGETYTTDEDRPRASVTWITPGYFRTFDVDLRRGRDFGPQDARTTPPVAIVNETFAREHLAGAEAVGRRFRPVADPDTMPWVTIVGVAPDLYVAAIDQGEQTLATYYVPITQRDPSFLSIALRTAGADPLGMTAAVRQAVRTIDPDLPIYDVRTMQGYLESETWFYNVFGTLFIVFGLAALFMASVGLYGVLAFSVSRRVKEMGIRMALGANTRDVLGLVVRQGARQIAVGLTIGLVMAFGLSRVVRVIMFDVQPADPTVFGAIVLVIVTVGLAASLVPARRATAVDPIVALRYE